MEIDILGIDLAKRAFQLHGADRRGRALHRSKVMRADLLEAARTLHPRIIAMEACSSAHHWARRFQQLGIEVRLISPQYVIPFVKTNKNDRNDAEAIAEAAGRPTMRFFTVKSVEQQDMQAVHRVRELLVAQRTALINQARGLLGERGVTIAQSPEAFKRAVPQILGQCESQLRVRMHDAIPEQGRWLKAVVTGYFAYHAVPTNSRALGAFRHHVLNIWRRTLQRRSQKAGVTWAWMDKLAAAWLPPPRILHPWPTERFAVKHPRWEPSA